MSESLHAPELETTLGWLNTDRPLRFAEELQGQVVVLDFWTFCCINCIHVLPDLKYLEHKYRNDPVTFIGVHSAKFTNEASRENIRAAVLRYEIAHPVVMDESMKIWRSYAARSWPTIVLIDPRGYIVGTMAGEGHREELDRAIARTLQTARSEGTTADGPLSLKRERSVRATSGLAFPGKILADEETGRLFVADSNHNRIIIAEQPDEKGHARVIAVVGSGTIGSNDGPGASATFNHPQGMALAHDFLYVADTENHLIRAIDLETFQVTTVVGTGEMTNDRAGGGMGTGQGINSPWDLAMEGSTLYVAMAGTHQIWRIDLPVGFARALAGTGRENIVDGPCETSAFAQPSGICLLGGTIYVADSEVSAIRGIDLTTEQVFTVMGDGLFSFGDIDGQPPKAKLQHPLGVATWDRQLLVADSYNHKIKLIRPSDRSVRSLFGTGQPGTSTDDGRPAFFEPGGLSVTGDRLYVADTNNHRVLSIDLETGAWQEIGFDSLTRTQNEPAPLVAETDAISLVGDSEVDVILDVNLPGDAYLNPEAPWSIRVSNGDTTLAQKTGKGNSSPMRIGVPAGHADADWLVETSFTYCTDSDGGVCVPTELAWRVPVRSGGTATSLTVRGVVPATSP